MNQIKSFFNLFCNNIDQPITRLYYWTFTLGVVGLLLVLRLFQINLDLDLDNTIIVLDLVFMIPTIIMTVKRLNDIFGNSDYMIEFIIISTVLAFMPEFYDIGIWSWVIIGIIPSNFSNQIVTSVLYSLDYEIKKSIESNIYNEIVDRYQKQVKEEVYRKTF